MNECAKAASPSFICEDHICDHLVSHGSTPKMKSYFPFTRPCSLEVDYKILRKERAWKHNRPFCFFAAHTSDLLCEHFCVGTWGFSFVISSKLTFSMFLASRVQHWTFGRPSKCQNVCSFFLLPIGWVIQIVIECTRAQMNARMNARMNSPSFICADHICDQAFACRLSFQRDAQLALRRSHFEADISVGGEAF